MSRRYCHSPGSVPDTNIGSAHAVEISQARCHCLHRNLAASLPAMSFMAVDELSGLNFLVDTGACRSFVPKSPKKYRLSPYNGPRINTADGTPLRIYGVQKLHLKILNKTYVWNFIVADVSLPILGADFLVGHHLAVDMAGKRLIEMKPAHIPPMTTAATRERTATPEAATGEMTAAPTVATGEKKTGAMTAADEGERTANPTAATTNFKSESIRKKMEEILEEYKEVFTDELIYKKNSEPKHGVKHHITTEGPPIHSRFRRLPPDKLKAAKEVFRQMEKAGICRKASSPWASPLHMVPKADGSWRPCGDYRRLNNATKPDHYPLPNIADITNVLGGAKFFSKIDLLKGYFQIPVAEEDKEKTAIVTPFGTFIFNFTCFGLRNAGATFQRMMDQIFEDIPCVIVYIDDILIFSKTLKQHYQDIRKVLRILKENGLVVRKDKCEWVKTSVEFLGHHLNARGLAPLPQKVEAINKFPKPRSVKNMQEFAGMVNYYHRFLPSLADIMHPLYEALKGKPKKLNWTSELNKAFEETKQALANATRLAYPQEKGRLYLTTDASSKAIGGVLEQETEEGRRPLSFFSRKLTPAEEKYSTFDRELLAVHRGVRHFHHFVEGRPFIIETDHLPLINAFMKKADAWSPRQQRQLSAIAEYPCTMTYIRGKSNRVADALSRNSVNAIQLGLSYKRIAEEQKNDEDLQRLRQERKALTWLESKVAGVPLICETSCGRPRPFIPRILRQEVFQQCHNLSHPSAKSTIKIITERYIWNNMKADIRKWCRQCIKCQTSKVIRHTESGIGNFESSTARLAHLHVDIVGPLPPSEGYRYLFTIIDRNTRWTDAIPLRTQTAEACARALLTWVARYGVPESIVSDRGANFTSDLWAELSKSLGFKLQHTTAYNPEANGIIERFHRTLKSSLTASCTSPLWSRKLPWVMLGLRTTPHSAFNASPAEVLYGQCLRIPADLLPSNEESMTIEEIARKCDSFLPPKKTYAEVTKKYIPEKLHTCRFVFVRVDAHKPPLSPAYSGPYPVLQRGEKAFKLKMNNGENWVSIDRLKVAYLEN